MAAIPPTIIDHPSLYSVDRAGQLIVAIVVHGTAGHDSLAYLTTNPRSVSVHYLIPRSGDTIYRMVPEARGANHAGATSSSFSLNGKTYTGAAVNRATVGIELESMQTGRDDYTDPQLLALGWLINVLRDRYAAIPLLRHADLDPTRRRDPVNLTRDTMEKWGMSATLVYGLPSPLEPNPMRYRVRPIQISQRQIGGPPYAGELAPGDLVEIDIIYANNMAHLVSGLGFVPISALEPAGG